MHNSPLNKTSTMHWWPHQEQTTSNRRDSQRLEQSWTNTNKSSTGSTKADSIKHNDAEHTEQQGHLPIITGEANLGQENRNWEMSDNNQPGGSGTKFYLDQRPSCGLLKRKENQQSGNVMWAGRLWSSTGKRGGSLENSADGMLWISSSISLNEMSEDSEGLWGHGRKSFLLAVVTELGAETIKPIYQSHLQHLESFMI